MAVAVALNGTVATGMGPRTASRFFERGAAGWALTGTIAVQYATSSVSTTVYLRATGKPFSNRTCVPPYQQFRKLGWRLDAGRHHRRAALRL
jgi:hypothetical protein